MATPCTSDWAAIRIGSGTSIQRAVSTSLSHLAGSNAPASPLILHTLPKPGSLAAVNGAANSSSSAPSINEKASAAALGKLVSVVEIIKRSFEPHQRAAWQASNESEQRKLDKRRRKQGRKRVRESDGADLPESDGAAGLPDGSINNVPQTSSSTLKHQNPRILRRIFQYNILDCYERMDGVASTSTNHGDASSDSDSDSESGGEGDTAGDDLVHDQAPTQRIADDPAQAALNDAIMSRVVDNRKRPRRKHTPSLFCVLSTTRLPEYEQELIKAGKEFTMQQPPKTRRPRKRSKKVVAGAGEVEAEGDAEDQEGVDVGTDGEEIHPDNGQGETAPGGQVEVAQAVSVPGEPETTAAVLLQTDATAA